MILHGADDARALVYPQFFAPVELSDLELAALIRLERTPGTPEGQAIAAGIVRVCEEHGNVASPCEFTAYRGTLCGRAIEVKVIEPEQNTRLCGPAVMNELVVSDGSILGLPRTAKWEKVFEEGVATHLRFLDAFAALAASQLEETALSGAIDRGEEVVVKVKIVRSGADINLKIDEVATRYITSANKKIDIRGPVFLTVVAKKA
jgi:O-phosphoseryl-tRNA synthetase